MVRALELDEGDRHQPWADVVLRTSVSQAVPSSLRLSPRDSATRRCRPNWSRTTTPEYSLRTSTTTENR